MTNITLMGKRDTENPHRRIDERGDVSAKPRRGYLLFKKTTISVMLLFVAYAACAAKPRHNSRSRNNDALIQGMSGLVGGLVGAAQQQQAEQNRQAQIRAQQQAQYEAQQRAEQERQRQLSYQRQQQQLAEQERERQQELLRMREQQCELENHKLELERARRREQADGDAWVVFGFHIPPWLWQSLAATFIGWLIVCAIKGMFGKRS